MKKYKYKYNFSLLFRKLWKKNSIKIFYILLMCQKNAHIISLWHLNSIKLQSERTETLNFTFHAVKLKSNITLQRFYRCLIRFCVQALLRLRQKIQVQRLSMVRSIGKMKDCGLNYSAHWDRPSTKSSRNKKYLHAQLHRSSNPETSFSFFIFLFNSIPLHRLHGDLLCHATVSIASSVKLFQRNVILFFCIFFLQKLRSVFIGHTRI